MKQQMFFRYKYNLFFCLCINLSLSLRLLCPSKEKQVIHHYEVPAGLTTFLTMAYILAVNPNILSATGRFWSV